MVIDLSNLREAIDNDRELERELFVEFISSSALLIQDLEKHCAGGSDNDAWRSAAHALKGIAANLGASSLSEYAKNAQNSFEGSLDVKKEILASIIADHGEVVNFLNRNM